jgi:phosphoadenosine phosphosulfate reductase
VWLASARRVPYASRMRLSADDLVGVNQRLEGASPTDVLRFAHETFGARAALLSSMQRAGLILAHMADRAGLAFDVLFVDTGLLHPETLTARNEVARTHPNLRLRTLSPSRTFAQQTSDEGLLYVSAEGQARCCDLRKSAPLRDQRGKYDALVSALRRGEGGRRKSIPAVALDAEQGSLRFHPFAHTTDEALDGYVAAHADVVENALHAMGFPTIGCYTCTTPVLPDEDARAGRWRHLEGVRYCGINPTDVADPSAEPPTLELDDRYAAPLGLSPAR